MAGRHTAPRRTAPVSRYRWAALGLVIGLVCGYTAFSVHTWAGFEERTTAWSEESQDLFETVSADLDRPLEQRAVEVPRIRRSIDRLSADAEAMCTPRAVVRWQSSLGAASERQQSCRQSVEQGEQVAEKLDLVARYLEDEATVAAALQPLGTGPAEATEAEFSTILRAWRGARDEIAGTTTSAAFEPTRDDVLTALDEVIAAWEAVEAAHEEQDLFAFAEARDALGPSYESLADIGEASAGRLAVLDEAFLEAYREAYAGR